MSNKNYHPHHHHHQDHHHHHRHSISTTTSYVSLLLCRRAVVVEPSLTDMMMSGFKILDDERFVDYRHEKTLAFFMYAFILCKHKNSSVTYLLQHTFIKVDRCMLGYRHNILLMFHWALLASLLCPSIVIFKWRLKKKEKIEIRTFCIVLGENV